MLQDSPSAAGSEGLDFDINHSKPRALDLDFPDPPILYSERDYIHQPQLQASQIAHALPAEILGLIFEWYAALCCTFSAAAPESSAYSLTQVCRRWRELAFSLPSLWNHPPIIRISHDATKDDIFLSYWGTVLERSANLPLKLHLSFHLDDICRELCSFVRPFVQCSARW
jgi:hypothetical protein